MEAQTCLPQISANLGTIATCFGAQRIAIAKIALAFLYLLVTGSFVASVGLLILYRKRLTAQPSS